MHLRFQLLVILTLIFTSGCNDSRSKNLSSLLSGAPGRAQSGVLIPFGNLRVKDPATGNPLQTMASQMLVVGSSLIVSGKPFGLAVWDIGSNPKAPQSLYSYSSNINNFSQIPGWAPDYYASGGLAFINSGTPLLLTSGLAGASLINAQSLNQLVEVNRFPIRNLNQSQVPQDPWFTYKAVVGQSGYFYGFREQDFAVSLSASANQASPVSQLRYSNNGQKGTCCVMGGAVFQGNAYIGFRSNVRKFSFGGNGQMSEVGIYNDLNGTNVVSTSRYLYVQHQAVPGNSYPSGIYVFDSGLNVVAMLPILPVVFAVSADDNYIYANMDNDSVQIFTANWGQSGF